MIRKNKKSAEIDDNAKKYFKEINKYAPLSREMEWNLWYKFKHNNDIDARNQLVQANLKFVASVAKHYLGMGLSYSDLIAEGNYGLIKAMEKFDASKGNKAISYSVWWIRQSILEALNKRNSLESEDLPSDVDAPERKMEDSEFYKEKSEETINEVFINDYNEFNNNSRDSKELVSLMLKLLSEKEKKIIVGYFGLDGGKPMTLDEIGEELNLTKERVRQISNKALKKMRSFAVTVNNNFD